ncbi:MAG: N(4)-(beta-N-acetylglucosaminyl)-L-asparaginase [Flavobacteriaceae bacterium]
MKRRNFFSKMGMAISGFLGLSSFEAKSQITYASKKPFKSSPFSIGTWNCPEAILISGQLMQSGISALDAVVKGVAFEEANEENTTVGFGASPDRSGRITLDACVMDDKGNCGAVMAVENIMHVAKLAQKVMEDTPHVYLAGTGAEEFAYSKGFKKTTLLTPPAKKRWEAWLQKSKYSPKINVENHDTIGMLCLDAYGNLSGSCTTSGLAYKMKGRVGDSPIIGSGLFVDNEVGAATATGLGEAVIKTVGSFLIVELMRNGWSPQKACEEAIKRILSKQSGKPDFQVGFIAINRAGEKGAYSIHKGFSYTYFKSGKAINISSASEY